MLGERPSVGTEQGDALAKVGLGVYQELGNDHAEVLCGNGVLVKKSVRPLQPINVIRLRLTCLVLSL